MTHRNRLLNGASVVALLAGLSFYTHTAGATTIGFDDLTDAGFGTPITNGYQGLNWTNWSVLNTAAFTSFFGPSGATPGTGSPPNVAFNPTGGEAIFSESSPFTLNSADLTAFWRDNLQVTVTGLLNGVVEHTIMLALSATAATLETFNWTDINEVDFVGSGGTHHSAYSGSGTQVALDNLTITTGSSVTPSRPALAIGSATAYAQQSLPLSYYARHNLGAPLLEPRPVSVAPPVAAGTVVGPWQSTNNPFPGVGTPANPLLLTDGTVIVHLIDNSFAGTRNWFQLTPDINGSYVNGTWSTFASLPAGYGPLFHASEVLPDGRVVMNGGEFNLGVADDTNLGAIYYPSLGAWTKVAPPSFMTKIGDAPSVVLNNGTYLLASCCDFPGEAALFNATPPFTSAKWTLTGSGKANMFYNEEGLTVLPKGNVLDVDVQNDSQGGTSEIYSATAGTWSSGGATRATLTTCNSSPLSACELGPSVLRPDVATNGSGDNVLTFGGVNEGADPTVIYNTNTGAWSAGPNVPSVGGVPYTLADAPAAQLPSGNVLFAASPSNWPASNSFPNPTNYFEVGPASGGNLITPITQNPDGPFSNSFGWKFLVLPSGQVLAVAGEFSSNVWIYTPLAGAANASWRPVIKTSPIEVTRGNTYTLTGTQFNGLSHGAAYGDDVQANTNYPIVNIVNNATGHVFYEQTFGFNAMSVARNTASSTNFTVSGKTETGPSELFVIANGISSAGVPVTVH